MVIARRAQVQKDEARSRRLLQAIREGWKAYLRNPAETNALMQKLNPSMDAETFAAIAQKEREFIETRETRKQGLGSMSAARWETLSQQLVEIGLIQKAPASDRLFWNLL